MTCSFRELVNCCFLVILNQQDDIFKAHYITFPESKASPEEVKITTINRSKVRTKNRTTQSYSNFIRRQLASNEQLSHETINLAQYLLHKQFPITKRFEDITLGKLQQFSVHKSRFIQIIHDNNHWVTIYADSDSDESIAYLCNSFAKIAGQCSCNKANMSYSKLKQHDN